MNGVEVESKIGVVAANPQAAADIGARVLGQGGNAMDAAVAAGLACCMLEPNQTGVGGYVCAAVLLDAKTDTVWSIDANAVAPAAARADMYERIDGPLSPPVGINEGEYACTVRDNANVHGPLSVAVPGVLAGMGVIHERWGKLAWPEVLVPCQALLEEGFPYGAVAQAIRDTQNPIRRFSETARHLMPDGQLPEAADIWHRPDMEKTLKQLAREGWRDFYDGELARRMVDHLRSTGGIMTLDDMSSYQPRVTEPYTVSYGPATVHGAILTNGALTGLQVLNMLAALDLPAVDSAEYFHLYGEVLKLAWRDRLRYLADPEFVDVPVEKLLNPDYAAGRVESLRQFPCHVDARVPPAQPEPPNGTRHISAADAAGNVVSMTISQGGAFGSCVTVPDTGIILGHGMCRLDPRPGLANSVAAGKRPLNNTCPMVVRMPDRDAAIGLPGGRLLLSVMPRAAQVMIDRGYTAREAATAPRMHTTGAEPLIVQESAGADTAEDLRQMGHQVTMQAQVAGDFNGAECLKQGTITRAGSNASVACAEPDCA